MVRFIHKRPQSKQLTVFKDAAFGEKSKKTKEVINKGKNTKKTDIEDITEINDKNDKSDISGKVSRKPKNNNQSNNKA